MLLLLAGVGAVVGARRGLGTFGHSSAPTQPPRLNATLMRQAGGRAYEAGDYELARRFFARALAAQPDDPQARERLGCALLKLGRADSARVYLARSQKVATAGQCS